VGSLLAVLLVAAAAAYGAAAGLLLARPGYRLAVEPDEPWRVACPAGHPLPGWLGPVPCAACPGRVPVRLPLAAALCCAALAAAVGPRPELAVWLAAVPVVVLLAAVDLAVQRLPDVLTLPLAAAVAGGLGLAALLPGAAGDWPRALLGGAVLTGCYLVLFLVNPAGLGFGDVKLATTLGVALGWYGWDAVLLGTFAGFALATGYGLCLVALRRSGRRTAVAFGPSMALGALAAVLVAGLET
jgi:leader peptidase (prepilin peptidase)/N-methyltransferase